MTGSLTLPPGGWEGVIAAKGEKEARAWAARVGYEIPGEEPVATAPLAVNPPAQAAAASAEIPQPGGFAVAGAGEDPRVADLYQKFEAAQEHRDEVYRQQFEAAQQALMEQRMGPSLSERLFNLSAAFAAPKRQPGFSGVMDKIAPVMARDAADARSGRDQRATALRALQDQYAERGLMSEDAQLQHEQALLKLQMDAENKDNATQWSENYGRFLPKNKPVVLERGTVDGKTVFQYSDGTMRIPQEDGTMQVYDAGGRFLGTADAEGNPVDAPR